MFDFPLRCKGRRLPHAETGRRLYNDETTRRRYDGKKGFSEENVVSS
jgi:hypothetical protein